LAVKVPLSQEQTKENTELAHTNDSNIRALMMAGEKANGDVSGMADHIRFIPLSFDSTQSEESALRLITELRPDWKSADSKIEFIRFTDGITNTLLKAVNKKEGLPKEELDREAILLRAYGNGTELLIDRQRETQNHELLMAYDLAPTLLARFENGIMYRYIRGKVTAPADLREPRIYLAVARRLAQWHSTVPCLPSKATSGNNGTNDKVMVNGSSSTSTTIDYVAPGKPPPNMWTVMQKWILALPRSTEDERRKADVLQTELKKLIEELSQRPGLGKNGVSLRIRTWVYEQPEDSAGPSQHILHVHANVCETIARLCPL
jgi:ethanolamine kinase